MSKNCILSTIENYSFKMLKLSKTYILATRHNFTFYYSIPKEISESFFPFISKYVYSLSYFDHLY